MLYNIRHNASKHIINNTRHVVFSNQCRVDNIVMKYISKLCNCNVTAYHYRHLIKHHLIIRMLFDRT